MSAAVAPGKACQLERRVDCEPGRSLRWLLMHAPLSSAPAGTGQVTQTPYYWGVHEDVYCAGKESTFEFLEAVLLEVMDIFPCTYLHIGGDEVLHDDSSLST